MVAELIRPIDAMGWRAASHQLRRTRGASGSRARSEDRHRLAYDRHARPDIVSVRGLRLLLVLDEGVSDDVMLVCRRPKA